jgi:hypothetical protein
MSYGVPRFSAEAARRSLFLASAQTVPKRPCTFNQERSTQHQASAVRFTLYRFGFRTVHVLDTLYPH